MAAPTVPPLPPSLADERCPRCGAAFHCGMNDAQPCACVGLTLDPALLQGLRERYTGCLCLACLRALAENAVPEPTPAKPR